MQDGPSSLAVGNPWLLVEKPDTRTENGGFVRVAVDEGSFTVDPITWGLMEWHVPAMNHRRKKKWLYCYYCRGEANIWRGGNDFVARKRRKSNDLILEHWGFGEFGLNRLMGIVTRMPRLWGCDSFLGAWIPGWLVCWFWAFRLIFPRSWLVLDRSLCQRKRQNKNN